MNLESVDVTAGLGGFLAFFLLAVALYFLMRNMNVRLRRLAYREEQEATAAAGGSRPDHQPEATGSDATGPDATGPDATGPTGGPQDGPGLG
jgi:hypothetical protein